MVSGFFALLDDRYEYRPMETLDPDFRSGRHRKLR
jgi:hypothetical protein